MGKRNNLNSRKLDLMTCYKQCKEMVGQKRSDEKAYLIESKLDAE